MDLSNWQEGAARFASEETQRRVWSTIYAMGERPSIKSSTVVATDPDTVVATDPDWIDQLLLDVRNAVDETLEAKTFGPFCAAFTALQDAVSALNERVAV